MPEPKRPLKVFLCHAHADREPVRALYARLKREGVDVWLDKEKLLPGQDWEYEIRKAVRESDVVVVCLSKQFNQAGFRQKEVRIALDTAMEKPEGEIFIIPARLEECDSLESLSKWHWVDLFEDDGYEMLMRALRARADRIGATLQVKKNWLPKITSPNMNFEKHVEKKKSVVSTPDESESKTSDGKVEQKVIEDKEKRETAEKTEEEKKQRELKRALKKVDQEYKHQIRKIEWQHRWESFVGEIRYRLKLLRVYRVPILILLVTFGLIVPLLIRLSNLIPNIISEFNNTPTATIGLSSTPQQNLTSTEAFIPTEIFTPSSTPTEIITSTTPLSTEITDAKGVQMMLVPAGDFIYGDTLSGISKTISLDSFYIDKYEVTNAQYEAYVRANSLENSSWGLPRQDNSNHRSHYYNNPLYDDYPVIYVDVGGAVDYCEWRGARIPTAEEWEKAARGTNGRLYPWGDEKPNCDLLNFSGCAGEDTVKAGNYESGKSTYGVYDLAGNVWEWVSTGYVDEYVWGYSYNHVLYELRGGAWDSSVDQVSVYFQLKREVNRDNSYIYYNNGFRCVRDAVP